VLVAKAHGGSVRVSRDECLTTTSIVPGHNSCTSESSE